jgi:hypothetical protein
MIQFDPVKHHYTNVLTGENYISVSTLVNKFKSEFDKANISRAVADKRGISQAEVLAEWEKTNTDSKVIGTAIHAAIEEFCKAGTIQPAHQKVIEEFKKLGDFSKASGALLEQLVYSHAHKVAGTADIIYPDGKFFDVYDVKTNKKFNFFSQYRKSLKPPVDHFSDCEFNSYALQLSLYAYLYHIMTGRIARHLSIFYWDKINEAFTRYPIAYLKNDVENILKTI